MARYKKKKTQLKRSYGRVAGVAAYAFDKESDADSVSMADDSQIETSAQTRLSHEHFDRSTQNEGEDDLQDIALTSPEDFTPDLLKYWKQRHYLFSLFDGSSPHGELPLLDREGWYSVTPEPIAARIAQRCRSGVVLDAFCGVGGNAIQFALTCERVIAIDTDINKLRLARHNARIYDVEQFITFLHGDWRDFSKAYLSAHGQGNHQHTGSTSAADWHGCEKLDIDAIFLSPPWGGVDYRQLPSPVKGGVDDSSDTSVLAKSTGESAVTAGYYPLSALAPTGAHDMLTTARAMTQNICLYVPRNVALNDLIELAESTSPPGLRTKTLAEGSISVAIEEQWLAGQCKALACYFGELIEYDGG